MNIIGQRTTIHDRLMMQLRQKARPNTPVFVDDKTETLATIVQYEFDRLQQQIDDLKAGR
ncbi:hypothetical protein [Zavarzinella formosa]|uniref:hypothetical protein n=1 Tax=Zavarzinella formosa TaxID=360055 RepID=UPI0012F70EDE|nr:hypothetical protein [Zavarzinella formosa]